MVTKWRICGLDTKIEPVEVVAETAHFVTVRSRAWGGKGKEFDRREKKDGRIFDTFDEAKAAMVEAASVEVKHAEAEWQRLKDRLKKCNDMKAPNVEGNRMAAHEPKQER